MRVLVLLYLLLIPCATLYLRDKHRLGSDAPRTVALKAACTTMIVLAAVIWTAGAPEQLELFAILISAGLVFGLVGDVVICQKAPGGFVSGMIYFALGHLCYIAALLGVSSHAVWAIPVFIVIYLLLLFVLRKLGSRLGALLIPIMIYGAIITVMVSLAVTAPFSVRHGALLLFGAVLFAISDGILALGIAKTPAGNQLDQLLLGGKYKSHNDARVDSFGLYCYFIGQSLFAASICFLR